MIILLPPIQAALITISVFNGGVKKFPIKKKCRWALSHAYPSCADSIYEFNVGIKKLKTRTQTR